MANGRSGATAPGSRRRQSKKGTTPRTSPRRTSSPSPPSSPPRSSPGRVNTPTPPKPKPPSIKEYLAGDEAFQQARRGSKRSLNDFLSDLQRRRGEAKTSFKQTTQSMERDRERQLERMKDEFASRGLIHSGLYAKEQGEFQEDFAQQMQSLEQQQAGLLADLISERTNFRREQELAMEAARQEALARRASRHNL